jgi:ribosomal protein S18 acetylase RimI-like enzyme
MLIEALERWAQRWGASETILWVYGGNASALTFYRELGFEVIRGGQDAESGARFGALAMHRAIREAGTPMLGDAPLW